MSFLYVGIGGFLGAMSRYIVNEVIKKISLSINHFPLETLIVNVLGSFCVGILVANFDMALPQYKNIWLLLVIGFFGAFTTFSSFALENLIFLQRGNTIYAFINITANIFLSIFAVYCGQKIFF